MALHLPVGPLKTRSGLEPVRDANPVPTSPFADDITTAPSRPVSFLSRVVTFILQSAGGSNTFTGGAPKIGGRR